VAYWSDVYERAGADFTRWPEDHDPPMGSHASIADTSGLDAGQKVSDMKVDYAVAPIRQLLSASATAVVR